MKYYYTDPLKAAWMCKEFKINLQIPHSYKDEDYGMLNITSLQVDASEDGTAHSIEAENNNGNTFSFEGEDPDDRYSGNYYVRPDDYEMLKPKFGDLIYTKKGYPQFVAKIEEENAGVFWIMDGQYLSCSIHDVQIIQRNGKAFFAPEVDNG